MSKVKIYCWDNTPGDHEWHVGYAMTETGIVLTSHCSSSHGWSKHDMMEMHRSDYVAKFGEEGFEAIWLEEPKKDAGWLAATALNKEAGEAAKAEREAANQ